MLHPKRILICPLDWGLGHAARCVPIIRLLISAGFEVVLAADHEPFELLKKEFPEIECIRFPSYRISYDHSMALSMLLSIPKIFFGIRKEHQKLNQLIEEHRIDMVISDNRFGLWTRKVPCVFITHQLMIKCPPYLSFLEILLHRINMFFVSKYNQCWVPDFEDENNLSADLSHRFSIPKNTFFIGPLSRFYELDTQLKEVEKIDLLVILSGPEPQRTIFEKILLKQLNPLIHLKTVLVRGLPSETHALQGPPHIQVFSFLNTEQLLPYLQSSDYVVSRAGYSSVMDFSVFGKKAILVPTPGQTEQEYLAFKLKTNKIAYAIDQKNFNIAIALNEVNHFRGIPKVELPYTHWREKILSLIDQLLVNRYAG